MNEDFEKMVPATDLGPEFGSLGAALKRQWILDRVNRAAFERQLETTRNHIETPSVLWQKMVRKSADIALPPLHPGDRPDQAETWENNLYMVSARRYRKGFFVGNSEYAILGIMVNDNTARHDWREFQWIKNDIVGNQWEAVELYPAEKRLRDPSNLFYLWCAPEGCFQFGFETRLVLKSGEGIAPQRPFAQETP